MYGATSVQIAWLDFQILKRDWVPGVVLVCMPLALVSFVTPMYRRMMLDAGVVEASGAEHAVPALLVIFAFFIMNNVGFAYFREHEWKTWVRLRATGAGSGAVLIGKAFLPFSIAAIQLIALFVFGGLFLDLPIGLHWKALAWIGLTMDIAIVSAGFLLVSFCRTLPQVNVAVNLGAMVFAGLGGAIAPASLLPDWVNVLGRCLPTHWAMHGFELVLVQGQDLSDVWIIGIIQLLFAIAFGALAIVGFERKTTARGL